MWGVSSTGRVVFGIRQRLRRGFGPFGLRTQRAPVVRRNAAQLMLAHHLPSTVPTALPATQEQRKLPLPPFHGRRLRAASQRYPKIEGRVSCSFHTVQTSDFGSTASRVDDMPEERSKAPPSVAVPVRALTMPCVPTQGTAYSSQVSSHTLTSLDQDQVVARWIDRSFQHY